MKRVNQSRMAAILLLSALLASCGGEGGADTTEAVSTADSLQTTEAVTEAGPQSTVEAKDFGGENVHFLLYSNSDYQNSAMDVAAEETNGEALNDAVFLRNDKLIEKFNIDITWEDPGNATIAANKLKQAVLGGDDSYDISFISTYESTLAGIDGRMLDMNTVPHITLENPWWNGRMAKDTAIMDVNYFFIGDMNLDTWTQSYVTYYSKTVAANHDIDGLYDIVRNGEWTFDKLDELTRTVYRDVNGNGAYDENDLYGLTACSVCIDCFWAASGINMIVKDAEGVPSYSFDSQFYDMYDRIVNLLQAPQMLYTDRPQYTSKRDTYDRGAFMEDRALFFIEGLCVAGNLLRSMETDYGILPLPKYDAAQANYRTYSHTTHNSTVSLPVTSAGKVDMLGMILEDMAFYSMELVRPAYYENMLNAKLARDEESIEMLEIITTNVSYDLMFVLNHNFAFQQLRGALNRSDNAASFIEKQEKLLNSSIEKQITSIRENLAQ